MRGSKSNWLNKIWLRRISWVKAVRRFLREICVSFTKVLNREIWKTETWCSPNQLKPSKNRWFSVLATRKNRMKLLRTTIIWGRWLEANKVFARRMNLWHALRLKEGFIRHKLILSLDSWAPEIIKLLINSFTKGPSTSNKYNWWKSLRPIVKLLRKRIKGYMKMSIVMLMIFWLRSSM